MSKVFGIGLSKTGTTSLHAALDILGYRAGTFRHMRDLGLDHWFRGDFSPDYLKDFDAVTDLPIATWFRELDMRYPGSKFILTTRPLDHWLQSIKRQFQSNPASEPGHRRDVRLAQYGVTTFNEDRFRRIHAEHTEAVRAYFADRPQDLLEIDVFKGDSWEPLSSFLGKSIPDKPFPHVRPGARKTEQRLQSSGKDGDFAFIIPIVHPEGEQVENYAQIETVLRLTLTSMLNLDGPKPRIIVVCHRLPDWASLLPQNVTFLNVDDPPILRPGQHHRRFDKALKFILGTIWALHSGKPRFIMFCDGDDYLRHDLMQAIYKAERQSNRKDGYIVTRGIHVAQQWDEDQVALLGSFRVEDFDKTCGTCRIFNSNALKGAIDRISKELFTLPKKWKTDPDRREVRITEASIASTYKSCAPLFADEGGLVNVIGRHLRQSPTFDLEPLGEELVAKGCGHGNHAGKRAGDIHWQRITGFMENTEFVRRFGLEGALNAAKMRPAAMTIRGYLELSRTLKPRILKRLKLTMR